MKATGGDVRKRHVSLKKEGKAVAEPETDDGTKESEGDGKDVSKNTEVDDAGTKRGITGKSKLFR